MAQMPLLLLTAVDVRRATQAGVSRANTIDKMTIPAIKRQVAEQNAGGAVMAVDWTMPRIEKLEPAFSAKGLDDDVFRGMAERDTWVFASSYLDTDTNLWLPARGIIEGVIQSWEPDETDPAEFHGCNHAFAEVVHFEFTLNDVEYCYFDFKEREARFMGVSLTAPQRRALGA